MSQICFGSCLCGQVRFQVDGAFEQFYLCHCEYCRKDTGSAHAANLFTTTARLSWLCGDEKLVQFRLPGTRHTKCFCAVCGSALPYQQQDPALLVVPAGSLDAAIPLRPTAHLFVSRRASWDKDLAAVPVWDGLPE